MIYQHTQKSPLWLIAAAPLLVIVAISATASDADTTVVILSSLGAILFIAFSAHFSTLTVTVSSGTARAAFGRGWPRRTVQLSRVAGVQAVRNHWLYGFGIRWVPKGSLWNVWGLDAVEFSLDNGRVVRFGTDDVGGLLAVLSSRAGKTPS